ncbi:hypothetical protein BUC_5458 [Burkholderia pseudomallei 576]|nr:hypothetical protein BUC_5458 [Burkholderia pseudomallei 576]
MELCAFSGMEYRGGNQRKQNKFSNRSDGRDSSEDMSPTL